MARARLPVLRQPSRLVPGQATRECARVRVKESESANVRECESVAVRVRGFAPAQVALGHPPDEVPDACEPVREEQPDHHDREQAE